MRAGAITADLDIKAELGSIGDYCAHLGELG